MTHLQQLAQNAKNAAVKLALYDTETKNRGLLAISKALIARSREILEANARDLQESKTNGLRQNMLDRLTLSLERIEAMANGVVAVCHLPDPIGEILDELNRPNGLKITKIRVPLGVVGIIYEARPNVTVDSAALCLKSGNVAFLRGGKEAFHSNSILSKIMREALESEGICPDCIVFLDDTSRETAIAMMQLRGFIDVLIPRGGAGLIKSVLECACVPVIETGSGNCHLYVDSCADLPMAVSILQNAKCSRPSVCNSIETVLVARDIAKEFLLAAKSSLDSYSVEWRGCPETCAILSDATPATQADYAEEFNDYILACRVVGDVCEAIAHIKTFTTHHSECIVTNNDDVACKFLAEIDAAAVYHNASTRFTDGCEFGMGAEIGISTQKMHARGPMGMRELTSCKFIARGNGQIR